MWMTFEFCIRMICDLLNSFSMNILASYNWIKEFLDTDLSAEEFAKRTTAAGNSVERMEHLAQKFDKMVVGFVKEVKAHPNADKLRVAITDIGKETVEIVCGGLNLAAGMRVVVGLPGARVRWHGQGDLVELAKTKIRGVESYGMICAVDEIGFEALADGEQNIWDISELTDAKPGTPIAQALQLDDVIFDIEVTSNRPDCKSIIGQAREGAAVLGVNISPPGQRTVAAVPSGDTSTPFVVEVKEKELCPKYSAILLDHVTVRPSPWWLQKKLILAGYRPINNVVDITNLVLHEYGQPLHAFDANKLEGDKIVVRRAKNKEAFLALDGKEYALSSDMLVIADTKKPVAVAGVMGGEKSGTTPETKRVLLECATFDPVSVRRTARALNLYSDSQLLFEKGLSPQATGPALARAIELLCELSGASIASSMVEHEAQPYEPSVFPFDPEAANRLMGIELSEAQMKDILKRLGFQVDKGKVTVPYWRDHDIENRVDFTEEIARIYGYENVPAVLPSGQLALISQDPDLHWQRKVKTLLAGAGLTEAYSLALVSKQELERYQLNPEAALKLKNPLSVDHEYVRPSLIPSMLSSIEQNQKRFPSESLFELAPIYLPKKHDRPDEPYQLLMAFYGKESQELFLKAKGALARLLQEVGVESWSLERLTNDPKWHPGQSATVLIGNESCGTIGTVSADIAHAYGIDVAVVLVDISFTAARTHFQTIKSFHSTPSFPSVKRDLAFAIGDRVEYASLVAQLEKISPLLESVELFDVYRGKGVEEGKKSLAIHLSFRSNERTLEAAEVERELEKIRDVLQQEFGAIMRS